MHRNIRHLARHPRQRSSLRTKVICTLAGSALFLGFFASLQANMPGNDEGGNHRLSPVARSNAALSQKHSSANALAAGSEASTGSNAPAAAVPAQPDPANERIAPVSHVAVANAASAAVAESAAPAAAQPEVQAQAPVPAPAPAPAQSPSPAPSQANVADEARAITEKWAQAWSNRDVDQYLGFYGKDFAPEGGLSRSAWEQSRRQKISSRKSITVAIHDLVVDQESDSRLKVKFVQDYAADNFKEAGTTKSLTLVKETGAWRIVAETIAQK